jgi:hypothetical protein
MIVRWLTAATIVVSAALVGLVAWIAGLKGPANDRSMSAASLSAGSPPPSRTLTPIGRDSRVGRAIRTPRGGPNSPWQILEKGVSELDIVGADRLGDRA